MSASREYELKARAADPGALRRRLEERGWTRTFTGEMRDRRLDAPDRALESRDEVLRVRSYAGPAGSTCTVLGWKGPVSTEAGFKVREEVEVEVANGAPIRDILSRLGHGEVTHAIDRRIERYEKGATSVRIEEYPRMDVLVEIEGPPAEVERRIEELGLPRREWVDWQLPDFVEAFERRTGEKAELTWSRVDG